MKRLKILLSIIGVIALSACGGGGGSSTASTSTGGTVTGVATAAQVSVVTAK